MLLMECARRFRRDERYGLICHSKYTNPAAIADTTTKCMNSLLTIDCCNVCHAGNQRRSMGTARSGFRQLISKILDVGRVEADNVALDVDRHTEIRPDDRGQMMDESYYVMWALPCIRLKTSQSNCFGVTAWNGIGPIEPRSR